MTDQGAGPGWKGWHGLARSGRPLTSEPPSGRRREIHDGSTPPPDRPERSDATGGAGTPIDATSGTGALIERAIVLMLFGGLVLGVLLVLQPLATAILFGAILAIATWPLRSALLRLGLGHGAAAMLMFLAAVLLAGLPLLAAAPRLATALTEGALRLEALLATFPAGPPDWLAHLPLAGDRLARGWRDLASAGADLQTALAPYASWIRQSVLAVAGALADSVLQFVLALIVAATFWANGDAVAAVLRDVVRRLGGETAAEALEAAGASLRSVAYGVVGTACIQGILMALGAAIAFLPAGCVTTSRPQGAAADQGRRRCCSTNGPDRRLVRGRRHPHPNPRPLVVNARRMNPARTSWSRRVPVRTSEAPHARLQPRASC
jgi:hypothetical protein